MKKTFLVILFVLFSLFSSGEKTAAAAPSDAQLSDAILFVKQTFAISNSYSHFTYSYQAATEQQPFLWHFYWTTKNQAKQISVDCDAHHHILQYYTTQSPMPNHIIPRYSKKELQQKAEQWMAQKLPDLFPSLSLVSASFTDIHQGNYCYTYQRTIQGIPVPENTVVIYFHAMTGKLSQLSIHWAFDKTVPSVTPTISSQTAEKKLYSRMQPTLAYAADTSNSNSATAFLTYVPNYSDLSVNAISGEIHAIPSNNNPKIFARNQKEDAAEHSFSLSKEEEKKLIQSQHLISKDTAYHALQKCDPLYLPDDAQLISAYLTSSTKQDPALWHLALKNQEATSCSSYATINAETGTLLSFHTGLPNASDYQTHKKITTCPPLISGFLKTQLPDIYKQTKLNGDFPDGYLFSRTYHDIPYENNYIQINLEKRTGKICDFYLDWDFHLTFQEPKQLLSTKDVTNYYVHPLSLLYETDPNSSKQFRLVYKPDRKLLPIDATVLPNDKKEPLFLYNDLTNQSWKRTALLLSDIGIGFEGKYFSAKQPITEGEFYRLLHIILRNNTLLSECNNNTTLTRTKAVKIVIQTLGLEQIAKLKQIYHTGFADEKEIAPNHIGYIALAKGFHLIKGTSFHPNQLCTRLDAIQLFYQLLKTNLSF